MESPQAPADYSGQDESADPQPLHLLLNRIALDAIVYQEDLAGKGAVITPQHPGCRGERDEKLAFLCC